MSDVPRTDTSGPTSMPPKKKASPFARMSPEALRKGFTVIYDALEASGGKKVFPQEKDRARADSPYSVLLNQVVAACKQGDCAMSEVTARMKIAQMANYAGGFDSERISGVGGGFRLRKFRRRSSLSTVSSST